MRAIKYLLLGSVLGCTLSGVANAVTFTDDTFGFAPPAGASAVVDFEGALPTGFTLTGGLVRNTDDGLGAEPAIAEGVKENSFYLSANDGDSAILKSTTGYREVSLYWGSIDAYNTLDLLDALGGTIASYTGNQIEMPANGAQFQGSTNRRVNFKISGSDSPIYGLKFASKSPAFEVDNIAFSSAVPEPASWAMMIGGFGLVGGAMRRRPRHSTTVRFA